MCELIYLLVLLGLGYFGYGQLQKYWLQKKLDRFEKSKCPKDIVIVHGTPRTLTIPSGSPFVLKLLTYIKMAKIQYKYDGKIMNTFGPKGKTPWISLNGEHVADSQVCIDFLKKKYNVSFTKKYTDKERAVAHLVRVLFEDRIFWELLLWGFVWPGAGPEAIRRVLGIPWIFVKYMSCIYSRNAWAQGIARHPREVIEAWTEADMKAVSDIIGNNKFLLGDEPCEEDATVFGFCAQVLWGFPAASPYNKIVKEKYPNIVEYCNRMKETFFPDWDQLLKRQKSS